MFKTNSTIDNTMADVIMPYVFISGSRHGEMLQKISVVSAGTSNYR